jgi:deoxyguanosine kinase
MKKPGYIVIEGNIGAGKTSLAYALSRDISGKFVAERFAGNPFLHRFYEEPEKYAFQLELSFLADRYQQMKEEFSNRDMYNPLLVSDYYLSKSLLFARLTLKEDEYQLYRQLYDVIQHQLPRPDLYVYIHQPIEKLLLNIKKRGRSYERGITPDYLLNLQKAYLNYLNNKSNVSIIIIDAGNLDFVEKQSDYLKIRDYIINQDFKTGITRIQL